MKSLHLSVEASLKKLRTSYIDILYLHWWDYTTPVAEVMNGLHNLVVAGKVLYLGVSDTPSWIVTRANEYARNHGKTPFVIYQGAWSVLERDMEREIIPMCLSEGAKNPAYQPALSFGDLIETVLQAWRLRRGMCSRGGGCGRTRKNRGVSSPARPGA